MRKNTTGKQNILGYQHTSTGGIPNRHKLHFSKMYVGCRVNGSHHSLWQRVANPSTTLSRADTVVSNNFTRHVIFILQISAHWYFPQILESKFSAKQKQKKNKNPIFNILVCHISSTVDSQIYVHYNTSAELIPPGCYFSTSTSPFPLLYCSLHNAIKETTFESPHNCFLHFLTSVTRQRTIVSSLYLWHHCHYI